jgi:Na+/proline symporter
MSVSLVAIVVVVVVVVVVKVGGVTAVADVVAEHGALFVNGDVSVVEAVVLCTCVVQSELTVLLLFVAGPC